MNRSRFDGLEVLVHTPTGTARPTPLLFVHGAYTGAWCWEEHFLAYFAAAGFASYAVSLSGHGQSRGHEHLDSLSIADYVDDITHVVGKLPAPPVLIGHSMGGFVVQKFLERQAMPGAALICSVPPQGLMSSAFGLMMSKPGLMKELNRLMVGGQVALESLREALFAQPVDVADLTRYYQLAQAESFRAIWDMTLFNLPQPTQIRQTPLKVMGAELDLLIPASLVEMTARSYSTDAHIFPGMGHGVMLERDWKLPADYLLAWLKGLDQ
jgi:non-heme chloroperoxidase